MELDRWGRAEPTIGAHVELKSSNLIMLLPSLAGDLPNLLRAQPEMAANPFEMRPQQ